MNETKRCVFPSGRTKPDTRLRVIADVACSMYVYARSRSSLETRPETFVSAVSVSGDTLVLTLHPDDLVCYACWRSDETVVSTLTDLGFTEVLIIADEKRPTLVK